ncbi:hypothetical protein FSPOR_9174 [Fusarium sporotrichioides]|uniref:Uncharacterized protein n=1 Tax=Fusarium sporotrichioides TaxID=5514 RepID=A0A395RR52_FUSSP|nr:hypothetical protein FSPOR_9174 [Fusarium sporotrichioides]
MYGQRFRSRITQWLLDAPAVTDVGIPADAYTLVLQAGSYQNYFTDQFQQQIQQEIAWHKAFRALNSVYPFDGPVHQYHEMIQMCMIDTQEVDAIEALLNGTSSILRADFNLGVAQEFDSIVNDTRHLHVREWEDAWNAVMLSTIKQLTHEEDYNTRLSRNFEIRTD